ncbi:unnamed protein product [Echinostoma caproni]|uniref:BTB domain-containing protein n=1 Tax=Echinostoma caproni TaxID=27848 RepID=A0A183A6L4_9TREM|nr:unnamed protein product [Echinostoma caproni]
MLEHPIPSREYTQTLLQWIYDREPDRFSTNCFELHSITSERQRTLVQVVFQFNFIVPSPDYGAEEWIYCTLPPDPVPTQVDGGSKKVVNSMPHPFGLEPIALINKGLNLWRFSSTGADEPLLRKTVLYSPQLKCNPDWTQGDTVKYG